MPKADLTKEQQNILEILRTQPGSYLRELHQALTDLGESQFTYSPEFGDGWNDERWTVKELRDNLSKRGLIRNEYQSWYLTEEGRQELSQK